MKRKVKRWLSWVMFLFIVVLLLFFLLIKYIEPKQSLDLTYTPVHLEDRLIDMALNLKTELVLSEQDINALIKEHLDPDIHEQIRIVGAYFHVSDDVLNGTLHVTFANRFRAEMNVSYYFDWSNPTLSLIPRTFHVKDIELPIKWLNKETIPINIPLDSLVKINTIEERDGQLVIKFALNI